MHLDELNNSQIALLSILISFITGAAVSVMIIAVLIEDKGGQTVVNRTVNRIIERVEVAPIEESKIVQIVEERNLLDQGPDIEYLRGIYAAIFQGTRFQGGGVFISEDGTILTHDRFIRNNNLYTIRIGDESFTYLSGKEENGYIVLTPEKEIVAPFYSNVTSESIDLGDLVVAYGGFETAERYSRGFVSQIEKNKEGDVERIKVSAQSGEILNYSIIVDSESKLVGLLEDDWVYPINIDLIK